MDYADKTLQFYSDRYHFQNEHYMFVTLHNLQFLFESQNLLPAKVDLDNTAVDDMYKASAAFEKLPKSATQINVSKCLLYMVSPPIL